MDIAWEFAVHELFKLLFKPLFVLVAFIP